MAKYYGYGRVSTDRQTRWSLSDQEDMLEARARSLGLKFEYFPEVKSGSNQRDRVVLKQVIDLARSGDTIGVCWSDRFGRGGAEDIVLLHSLYDRGVRVDIAGQFFDASAPEVAFPVEMRLAIAKFFLQHQRQKAVKGTARMYQEGKVSFRPHMFGFRRTNARSQVRVEVVESEAKVLRRIFQLCNSDLSILSVCSTLALEGYRTRASASLSHSFVSHAICNPVYMGYTVASPKMLKCGKPDRHSLTPGELVKSVHYPAIIDSETWWAVYTRRMKKSRSKYPSAEQVHQRVFELAGLLECAWCKDHGKAVHFRGFAKELRHVASGITHVPIYSTSAHHKGCPTTPKGLSAPKLENLFRCLLTLVFKSAHEIESFVVPETDPSMGPPGLTQEERTSIEKTLGQKKRRASSLLLAIQTGTQDVMHLVAVRESLLCDISDLEGQLAIEQTPERPPALDMTLAVEQFSQENFERFFAVETSAEDRRLVYSGLIKQASLSKGDLNVCFKNGKSFAVKLGRGFTGAKRQRFVVNVSFKERIQECIHVAVGALPGEFMVAP